MNDKNTFHGCFQNRFLIYTHVISSKLAKLTDIFPGYYIGFDACINFKFFENIIKIACSHIECDAYFRCLLIYGNFSLVGLVRKGRWSMIHDIL